MSLHFHILKESGRLDRYISQVEKVCKDAEKKIVQVLPVKNVDIVIQDNPYYAIPEKGMGGHTRTPHIVVVSIDPASPALSANFNEELLDTLAHELHHAARWQTVGYGETLLQTMVSEGLADHFASETVGEKYVQPWDKALTPEQFNENSEKAKQEFNNKDYNHSEWFFGSKERHIPRWAGYTLGYQLVEKYLHNHAGQTAASLYKTKAEEFL
ncbi:MAG TPA: DUF2268 domain-containing putative Zn-dependent protease [Candidatus Saccharimonadales bacterium]|nr:DUF2268 domain-containing putative Zn-dependent protease [Candidatus Saccharimonadales bacterium]